MTGQGSIPLSVYDWLIVLALDLIDEGAQDDAIAKVLEREIEIELSIDEGDPDRLPQQGTVRFVAAVRVHASSWSAIGW